LVNESVLWVFICNRNAIIALIHDWLQQFSATEIGPSESSSEDTEETNGATDATKESQALSLHPRPLHHLEVERSELIFEDPDTEEQNVCQ
jgi:hypothetical protein